MKFDKVRLTFEDKDKKPFEGEDYDYILYHTGSSEVKPDFDDLARVTIIRSPTVEGAIGLFAAQMASIPVEGGVPEDSYVFVFPRIKGDHIKRYTVKRSE